MKKSFLLAFVFAFSLLCSNGLQAEGLEIIGFTSIESYDNSTHFSVLPGDYTSNKEPLIVISNGRDTFRVYDQNFNFIKDLNPRTREGVYGYVVSRLSPSGEWYIESDQRESRTSSDNAGGKSVEYVDMGINTYWNCYTQTLFNMDDKFEYIAEVYEPYISAVDEKDTNGDGVIDYKEEYYGTTLIGYQIVSEDGQVLGQLPYYSGYRMLDVFKVANQVFFIVGENTLYRWDPISSSMSKVADFDGFKALPSVARPGTDIVLDLSGEAEGEIRLVSTDGKLISKQPVAKGQKKAFINTRNLRSGMYVVTVGRDNETQESCKVIIR